ncbi:hypothetical protein AVEN_71935-1 [Araneus ventricosus]|uniref:Uncharacterized protein n=1 Tax=Araneus ventricosus TaxID=182803 RepID=A0A4Y2LXF8_ARAVE|nr:hypothetical protein AVEN_71935-1 [Araneus ventricosus]
MFRKFVAHTRERLSKAPYDMFKNSGPTTPPTTEPNKGRQPPALGIPSLGAYFGASRNLPGYFVVHEKQEANRAATAPHGELPRLPSKYERKR